MGYQYPKVYIIILNWNKWKETVECLCSVYAMDYDNFEVILIDNGSTDDSVEKILKEYPDTRLIVNKKNYGYTGGCNQGLKLAISESADFVWLLNNDTMVEVGTLKGLIKCAQKNYAIGILSPSVYYFYEPDKPEFLGRCVDYDHFKIEELKHKAPDDLRSLLDEIEIILCGTAMLIRREVIEKIGYLKDDYFAYYEDTEYSLRAIKNGIVSYVDMCSKVYHKTRLQGAKVRSSYYHYYMTRNYYFMWIDLDLVRDEITFARTYIRSSLYNAANLYEAKLFDSSYAALDGMFDALLGRRGPQHLRSNKCRLLYKILLWHPYFIADIISPTRINQR